MPISTKHFPVERLLSSFAKICETDDTVKLVLSGKRCPEEIYSVWNFIDQHQLTDWIEYHPYYERCENFPIHKDACDVWISRNTPKSLITPKYLRDRLEQNKPNEQKYALFFTSFHPEKEEGNSTLMRLWLDHLQQAGYIVHVVYYMYDIGAVSSEMRRASLRNYDIYKEVPVTSKLTGANYNGLNVHVDDWCGIEALDAVDQLVGQYEYDIAITNYPFMSAVFDRISAYTKKILLTHDSFVDRNRRMLEQGYPESGWISLDARGEKLACERSDVVVAMQEHEAKKFREDTDPDKVCVIGPIFETKETLRPSQHEKLRIGYFGSSNWVNEQNLGEYLKLWANDPELIERSEIHIAGGVCKTLKDFVPASVLKKVNAKMVGRVENPGDFFATCDVIINPERGGTGIKIKTLEALSHGAPIITTHGGFVGLESTNDLHHADDFEELVQLTRSLLDNPEELNKLRADCITIYDHYVTQQTSRMNELLGAPVEQSVQSSNPSHEAKPTNQVLLSKPEPVSKESLPKVSIIIPFYGVEAFIEECITSVLNQDYPNLEIIFVDDQSPDQSRRIVNAYILKDERIRLVTHDTNMGLGPARNSGVHAATGLFIFFLDSDDFMSSRSAISALVEKAISTDCKVVVGSCDRVMTDGQRLHFDRDFDQSHNGNPDNLVSGRDAFLGASFIPGGRYVPMRAWGTLIDRYLYLDSGLEYPAAEHEDLPHTPFLYHFAQQVFYISEIVITYRDRSDSISNTGWDSGKILRQGLIWSNIRENLKRFELESLMGDAAVKTAEHLIMKLRQNGIQAGAEHDAFDIIEEILSDATGDLNEGLLFYMLDSLRGILDFQKYDYNLYQKLTGKLPRSKLTAYYRHRLSNGVESMGAVPIHHTPQTTPTMPKNDIVDRIDRTELKPHQEHTSYEVNHKRCQELISHYKSNAPKLLRKFPSMLTVGDKALYFDAGKNFQFKGSIVDAGCFVGGTTMSLVQGLLQNPLADQHSGELNHLIRVYDLFQIDDDYILEHLERNYPKHDFSQDKSFLKVFNDNLREYDSMLDVRPGDVIETGYQDEAPIEVLGVDLCKALPVTDFVIREFFPRLIPGARVIQQDFIHQYHPHIHLSMMILEDYFDLDYEVQWGGSVSYILKKTITPKLILDRFGSDSSWFNKKSQNVMLLKALEKQMLYDENKWVILQVLGVYYSAMNDHANARLTTQQLGERFPQFDVPEEVRRLTGV